MRDRTVVGIAGSLFAPSRSGALVAAVLGDLAGRGWPTRLIDLSALPADALLAREKAPAVDEALAAVAGCAIVVLGTPTYRASYAGQLKAFFDLLPQNALGGCVAGLIATGGVPHHALTIEHQLRPLVASLGGLSAAHGIYATDEMFPGGAQSPIPAPLGQAVADLATELDSLAATRP